MLSSQRPCPTSGGQNYVAYPKAVRKRARPLVTAMIVKIAKWSIVQKQVLNATGFGTKFITKTSAVIEQRG